jgi:hypothetical protein
MPDIRTGHATEGTPGLPDEHFAAIGRVAEAWASLELLIDAACWKLAGLEGDVGVCLTSQVSGHARKLDAYVALMRLRGADDAAIKQMNKLAEKARGIAEQRNRVVHDPWMARGALDVPHRMEASARKVAVLKLVPMLTEEVQQLIGVIDELWSEFSAIMEEADKLPPSS